MVPSIKKQKEFSLSKLKDIAEIAKFDNDLTKKIIDGVIKNREEIDEIIKELAPEWPIEKISKIDLCILRIAIMEGFVSKTVPEKVAVNEAIELTKEFSNEQSRKFVSGVLGTLITQNKRINKK